MSSCFLFYLFFTITACNSSDTTVKIEQINAGLSKISAGKPEKVNLLSELNSTGRGNPKDRKSCFSCCSRSYRIQNYRWENLHPLSTGKR